MTYVYVVKSWSVEGAEPWLDWFTTKQAAMATAKELLLLQLSKPVAILNRNEIARWQTSTGGGTVVWKQYY